jgi:hypothetical protein
VHALMRRLFKKNRSGHFKTVEIGWGPGNQFGYIKVINWSVLDKPLQRLGDAAAKALRERVIEYLNSSEPTDVENRYMEAMKMAERGR